MIHKKASKKCVDCNQRCFSSNEFKKINNTEKKIRYLANANKMLTARLKKEILIIYEKSSVSVVDLYVGSDTNDTKRIQRACLDEKIRCAINRKIKILKDLEQMPNEKKESDFVVCNCCRLDEFV